MIVMATPSPAARDRLASAAHIVEVEQLNVPALLDAVRDADALVVRSETEDKDRGALAAGRNLRVVARAGVGVDNIDLNAASPGRGLGPQHSRGANADLTRRSTPSPCCLPSPARSCYREISPPVPGDWPA